jgi:hypothetical protein
MRLERPIAVRYIETGMGQGSIDLPVRYLPPGSVRDLFDQYLGVGQTPAAKYGSFLKLWNAKWSAVLKFRTHTEHGECKDCYTYKYKKTAAKDSSMEVFFLHW